MKFKFHLYIQKHPNQTYTVTPVPFYDLSTYGANLDDVKTELVEAIKERVEGMAAPMLQHIEFELGPDHAQSPGRAAPNGPQKAQEAPRAGADPLQPARPPGRR